MKHCSEMCTGIEGVRADLEIGCLCAYECMWGHCGHTRHGKNGDCCLCGWSTWTDSADIAKRREMSFVAIAEMGFSL